MPLGKGLESLLPKPPKNENPDSSTQHTAGPALSSEEPLPEKETFVPQNLQVEQKIQPQTGFSYEPSVKESVFQIEVEKIAPNPFQPRRDFNEEELKELSKSIQEFGILQPLVVLKIENETERGTEVSYQLIAGERRLRAAKMAGLLKAPCIIRRTDRDVEQLEIATVENLQRSNLNPIETARAYAKLQDEFKMTQREIAARIGKSRESIANALRLLNLPSDIQDALMRGVISESHGRLLLSVEEDLVLQRALFNDIQKNSMSVRELKTRIRSTGENRSARQSAEQTDPEEELIKEGLEEALGTRVKIEKGKEGGRVIISFYSREELEALLAKFKGGGSPPPPPHESP